MLSRFAALALALITLAPLAGCELTDPADDFRFSWPEAHAPDLNGEIHFDPAAPLPVRLVVTNPLDEPATLHLDDVVLRPLDGSGEAVIAAADRFAFTGGEVRTLVLGEVTLLPADRCVLSASGVLVGDETAAEVELDATSEVIVLYE